VVGGPVRSALGSALPQAGVAVVQRVVFVLPSLQRGGAEGHVLRLSAGLGAQGWSACVVTLFDAGPWAARCTVPLYCLGCTGLRDPRLLPRLRSCLARLRPDVVHSFLFGMDSISMVAAGLAGVGVKLASCRSMPDGVPGPRHKLLEKLGARWATRVVCCADAVADAWAAEGADRARYVTVYTGVDVDAFSPAASSAKRSAVRRSLGMPDVPTAVCTANLSSVKRHGLLLRAFLRVTGSVKEARLVLVGRDDSSGAVAGMAEELGARTSVDLLGPRDDVPAILRASDVGVLASSTEGLPNAVLEYMAAGLAVVATDVGGVGEAVERGVTGLLVPPKDEAALGDALVSLLSDPERASCMGAAGRRSAVSRFAIGRSVRDHAELYASLLERGA